MAATLRSVLADLLPLVKKLESSFGPCGSDICILQKETDAAVFVSNDGQQIINGSNCSHPITRLILESAKSFCNSNGDGSKSFILLLYYSLKDLTTYILNARNSVQSKCRQITVAFCLAELKAIVDELALSSPARDAVLASLKEKEAHSLIQKLSKSSINGKTRQSIVDALSALVCEILVSFKKDGVTWKETVDEILIRFETLCLQCTGHSVRKSCCLRGIYINRKLHGSLLQDTLCKNSTGFTKFIMLSCQLQYSEESDQQYFSSSDIISQSLSLLHLRIKTFAEKLQQNGVCFVFTESGIRADLIQLLESYGISIATHVPNDEIKALCWQYHVQSAPDFAMLMSCDDLSPYTAKALEIKEERINGKTFIKIDNGTSSSICLCAATQKLWQFYYTIIFKALKTISIAITDKDTVSVVPCGCCFELWLHHMLNAQTFPQMESMRQCVSAFDRGLLSLPRALHMTSRPLHNLHSFQKLIAECNLGNDCLQGETRTLCAVTGKLTKMSDASLLEPTKLKRNLLNEVLQTLSQVVRIETVIPMKSLASRGRSSLDRGNDASDSDETG